MSKITFTDRPGSGAYLLNIGDANIFWKNFSGKNDKYDSNPTHKHFTVEIEDADMAEKLRADGWNVRHHEPRNEEDTALETLKVNVNYGDRNNPQIYLIAGDTMKLLDKDTVGQLDDAEIVKVDMVINPYHWHVNREEGLSAYLKTMYVKVYVDEFFNQYADLM